MAAHRHTHFPACDAVLQDLDDTIVHMRLRSSQFVGQGIKQDTQVRFLNVHNKDDVHSSVLDNGALDGVRV